MSCPFLGGRGPPTRRWRGLASMAERVAPALPRLRLTAACVPARRMLRCERKRLRKGACPCSKRNKLAMRGNHGRHRPSSPLGSLHPGVEGRARWRRRADLPPMRSSSISRMRSRRTRRRPRATMLAGTLARGGYGRRLRIVRINALSTRLGRRGCGGRGAHGLRRGAAAEGRGRRTTWRRCRAIIGPLPVWAMMETPRGVPERAGHRGCAGDGGLRHGHQRSGQGPGLRHRRRTGRR